MAYTKAYTYYPGCSLHGSARHCQESLFAVFNALDLELRELPDWNCCGATTYMSVDEHQAFALGARNLAIAERIGLEIVAPCTACLMILRKTQDYLARYPDLRTKIEAGLAAIGLKYQGTAQIYHPLEILLRDVGLKELKARVKNPLSQWNVAAYYGCLIARPYALHGGLTLEDFDQLVPALGAHLVDFELKDRCCGGSLTGTIEDVGQRLVYIILHQAKRAKADVIVTLCPLCQFNLESHQAKIQRQYGEDVTIPIPYFTQLIGMALGLSAKSLGLARLLVPIPWQAEERGPATAQRATAA